MPRLNQSTNPSCAVDTATWLGTNAVSRLTGLSGPPRTTGASMSTATGAFAQHFRVSGIANSSINTTWSCVGWFRTSITRNLRICLSTYNGTTFVQTFTGSLGDTSFTANTWAQARFVVTVPSNASAHTIKYVHVDFPTAVGSAGTIAGSSVRIEQVNDSAITYADGATPGWKWTGTAGSSTSTESGITRLFLPF